MNRTAASCCATLFAFAAALHSGCRTAAAQPSLPTPRLGAVNSWGYQLQGEKGAAIDLEQLRNSTFDLLVIDYQNQGRELTSEQVASLKRKPDGSSRQVVAYLSIGEAETYRFYWRKWNIKRPAFLSAPNPNWPDNHKVEYWRPAWQRILFGIGTGPRKSYLDRIIDAGFDGVYLDIIDAYEYFSPGGGGKVRATAAADMVRLVTRLATYARVARGRPEFVVIPQNGSGILGMVSDELRREYLAAIDAIAAEDTFHFGDAAENNPSNLQKEMLRELQSFQRYGKRVLVVEYLTRREWARAFVRRARNLGFVPYVGRRSLDRLVRQQN